MHGAVKSWPRFERDMTPHPQYVAFYKWIENDASYKFKVSKEHTTPELSNIYPTSY